MQQKFFFLILSSQWLSSARLNTYKTKYFFCFPKIFFLKLSNGPIILFPRIPQSALARKYLVFLAKKTCWFIYPVALAESGISIAAAFSIMLISSIRCRSIIWKERERERERERKRRTVYFSALFCDHHSHICLHQKYTESYIA